MRLTKEQRQEQEHLYGCTVDLGPDEEPDGCVLDYGGQDDCSYAKNRRTKWSCPCWELRTKFKASRPAMPKEEDTSTTKEKHDDQP